MAMTTAQSRLVEGLENALAMEEAVIGALAEMLSTTADKELRQHFERHHAESKLHAARLRGRLEAHGAQRASGVKDTAAKVVGKIKGAFETGGPTPTTATNARDAYVSEHLEIATYELLERVARAAGDEASADIARQNRQEDVAMAALIASSWDRVAVTGLAEEGALLAGAHVQADADHADDTTPASAPIVGGPGALPPAGGLG